ncbi:MAG: IS982 family transposase [Candidatus Dependentiae bacterium]
MLVNIFCEIDDFCKLIEEKSIGSTKKVGRKPKLSASEVLTIAIFFHCSRFKDFKTYYETMIKGFLRNAFNDVVSYNRFIELRQKYAMHLILFSQKRALGRCNGISIIDSSKLEVCHSRREYSHKTFKGIAAKGKTSTGWFYGFKLHLVINSKGEILSFFITPGNVADNNKDVLDKLTDNKVYGKLVGDKGYIGGFKRLYSKGIQLIHRIRKNMKNKLMDLFDKLLLRKRGVIESVIGILKAQYNLENVNFRSPMSLVVHVCATISAYSFRENKPAIFKERFIEISA